MKTLALASLFVASAQAWGRLGHETVALLAQQYLLPETISQVQEILQDTSPTYMGNVATWADSFRYEEEGKFTSGFHFVNGKDAPPPESCEIDFPGDCPPEGCIVTAIGNYTEKLKNKRTEAKERQQALKFVIHFLGDIAQPLHTEAYGQGGNNISITFNGYKTNLHAAWDTAIPNSIFSLAPNATINATHSLMFANKLSAGINVGPYQKDIKKWLKNHSVKSLKAEEKAAVAWATDGNREVCSEVITVDPATLQGKELGGGEYEIEARKVVERSVAKAGVRLAGWLNLIFEGKTGF